MTIHPLTLPSAHRTPRRSAARRRAPLSLFKPPAEERIAAAMDDAAQAERLIADLLALVDAGLVTPVDGIDGVRYTPTDPSDPAA